MVPAFPAACILQKTSGKRTRPTDATSTRKVPKIIVAAMRTPAMFDIRTTVLDGDIWRWRPIR